MEDSLDLRLLGTSDIFISCRAYVHTGKRVIKSARDKILEALEQDKNIPDNVEKEADKFIAECENSLDELDGRLTALSNPREKRPKSTISVCENDVLTTSSRCNICLNGLIRSLQTVDADALTKMTLAEAVRESNATLQNLPLIEEYIDQTTESRNKKLAALTLTPTYTKIMSITRDGYSDLSEMRSDAKKATFDVVRKKVSEEFFNDAQADTQGTIEEVVEEVKDIMYAEILSQLDQSIRNHFDPETSDFTEFLTSAPRHAANLSLESARSGIGNARFMEYATEAINQYYSEAYGSELIY